MIHYLVKLHKSLFLYDGRTVELLLFPGSYLNINIPPQSYMIVHMNPAKHWVEGLFRNQIKPKTSRNIRMV